MMTTITPTDSVVLKAARTMKRLIQVAAAISLTPLTIVLNAQNR